MNPFMILSYLTAAVRFIRVFFNLILVAGLGIAGFIYSPFFRSFFLGIAVGASVLFGLNYSSFHFLDKPSETACVHPKIDPNGPRCQTWVSTDDDKGYGYWKPCDGLQ